MACIIIYHTCRHINNIKCLLCRISLIYHVEGCLRHVLDVLSNYQIYIIVVFLVIENADPISSRNSKVSYILCRRLLDKCQMSCLFKRYIVYNRRYISYRECRLNIIQEQKLSDILCRRLLYTSQMACLTIRYIIAILVRYLECLL